MAKRLVGLALGVVGVGLVVACSSSSSSGGLQTAPDAGQTQDTGVVKDASPAKDSAVNHDSGPMVDATTSTDAGGDAGYYYDAGGTEICMSGITTNVPSCDTCLGGVAACCTAATACSADMTCSNCLGDPTGAGCAASATFTTFNSACSETSGACQTACAPVNSCNPVTNADCVTQVGAGATCDEGNNGYGCITGPGNSVALCGSCDNSSTFCAPGLTCVQTAASSTTGECVQYCCTNADCGTGGFCDLTLTPTGWGGGLCTTGSTSSDAGAVDAATVDAAATDAAAPGPTFVCTGIPATPPSGGSCITFNPDAGM
jgi:hypothetical protein